MDANISGFTVSKINGKKGHRGIVEKEQKTRSDIGVCATLNSGCILQYRHKSHSW